METSVRWPKFGQSTASAVKSKPRRPARRPGLGAFWPAFAGLALFSAPLPAFSDPTPPPGMVPYDHPVYQNGHRVLWRGAWRAKGLKKSEARAPAAAAPANGSQSVVANTPPVRAGEYSILVDGEDSAPRVWRANSSRRCAPKAPQGRVIAGRTSPAALAEAVNSDRADLALAPMDALAG